MDTLNIILHTCPLMTGVFYSFFACCYNRTMPARYEWAGQALSVVALRSIGTFDQNILMTSNPRLPGFFVSLCRNYAVIE